MNNGKDQLSQLQEKLEQLLIFPTIYMFKFILEADNRKIARIESLFDEKSTIRLRESSRKNYVSLTVKMPVENLSQIMNIYRKVEEIGGVMYF